VKMERISEVGVAVRNLEATTRLYTQVLGATASEIMPVDQYGNRARVCRIGSTDFRLMEPATEASPLAQMVARRGDCLHHVGFQVPDVEEAIDWMKRNQVRMIDEAPRAEDGVRFAFIHPEPFNNVMYKLIEGSYDLKYIPEPAEPRDIPGRVRMERVLEVGVNVLDLEAATSLITRVFGTKPTPVITIDMYDMLITMNRIGDIDIELMASITEDGVIARSIAKIGEGMSHIAFLVANMDEALAWMKRNHIRLIDETPRHLENLRVAFVHPEGFNGVMFELIEGLHPWFDH